MQRRLKGLVDFHKSHGKTATITTVSIDQQKGVLDIGPDNTIRSFREKAASDGAIINGGFMVLNPEVFSYLKDDTTVFEQEPMTRLAAEGQLMSFYHDGFWQCMDHPAGDAALRDAVAVWKRTVENMEGISDEV